MKALQIKFPLFFQFILITCCIGLASCGQQSEVTDSTDTAIVETAVTDTVTNSVAAGIDETDNTITVVKNDNKAKVTEPASTAKVEQKVITETNKTPVNTTTTVGNTATTPPVVIVTENVKKAPEVTPPPAEVPKPVVVTAPAPVQSDWPVPANYKTMKNPYAADKESIDLGRSLYGTHCRSCHGSKGDGKGTKAATIDTEIKTFLNAAFKSQLPGEVYYKSIIGRKDMPRFDKKIPDEEERWAVVNYIRSL